MLTTNDKFTVAAEQLLADDAYLLVIGSGDGPSSANRLDPSTLEVKPLPGQYSYASLTGGDLFRAAGSNFNTAYGNDLWVVHLASTVRRPLLADRSLSAFSHVALPGWLFVAVGKANATTTTTLLRLSLQP